jgi:hypothetical protein
VPVGHWPGGRPRAKQPPKHEEFPRIANPAMAGRIAFLTQSGRILTTDYTDSTDEEEYPWKNIRINLELGLLTDWVIVATLYIHENCSSTLGQ